MCDARGWVAAMGLMSGSASYYDGPRRPSTPTKAKKPKGRPQVKRAKAQKAQRLARKKARKRAAYRSR